MKYVRLGNSGLEVSKICLGAMSFAYTQSWKTWIIDEEESHKVIKKALDLGVNFFDTANLYTYGESEIILGKALKKYANRDRIVVATKVWCQMHEGPNGGGLSRKAIFSELEASLKRLDMDYIDLYIIHRWDYNTPIEETMKALHDLVQSGKVRYIGASSMLTYQFQQAQYIAEKNGWTKFISMQNHYNAIYREDERELVPFSIESGVALTPYSPLASGRLSKDPDNTTQTARASNDIVQNEKYDAFFKKDLGIIRRVKKLALKKNVSMSQVALAWMLAKPGITCPIIGVTKINHLEDAVKAVDLALTPAEIKYIDELYIPHELVGAIIKKH